LLDRQRTFYYGTGHCVEGKNRRGKSTCQPGTCGLEEVRRWRETEMGWTSDNHRSSTVSSVDNKYGTKIDYGMDGEKRKERSDE
jgi:hypothetical protein